MIYIRNFRGEILKARCRHCSHFLRELKGSRVDYLGGCYFCHKGLEGVVLSSVGVNNFACENFLPQPSFEVVEDNVQLKIF